MRILVGHCSPHGSTASIAEQVAGVLRRRGWSVDVHAIDDIGDPAAYDAVVLGSAVHDRAWLPGATGFLHRHQAALAARPVWLFSVGMPAGLPRIVRDRARAGEERQLAHALREVAHPVDHHLFSGVARAEQFPRWSGRFIRALGGHFGDYRDPAAIAAWADGIASHLARGAHS